MLYSNILIIQNASLRFFTEQNHFEMEDIVILP